MLQKCQNGQTSDAPLCTGARWQDWRSNIHELEPQQIDLFRLHLLRLDNDARWSRFGNPTSDTLLEQYAARVDAANTRVFGCVVDGHLRGAAELRSLRSDWCTEAELAFSVEKRWQALGIGTAMMAHAIHAALALGINQLHLSCHAFNRPMQRIAERFAASIAFGDGEWLAVVAVRSEQVSSALAEQAGLDELSDRIITLDLKPARDDRRRPSLDVWSRTQRSA